MEADAPGAQGAHATFRAVPTHAPGCACCGARTAAGRALATLLHDRARGRVPYFRRVVVVTVSEAGRLDVAAALRGDPVAGVCFRKEDLLFLKKKKQKNF